MGKLRQNTTRRTVLRVVNILAFKEKCSYGASYRVTTDKVVCTLMRDTDVILLTEISR